MTAPDQKLLPCPFRGCEPILSFLEDFACCKRCGVPFIDIKTWNTRASTAGEVEKVRKEAYAEGWTSGNNAAGGGLTYDEYQSGCV